LKNLKKIVPPGKEEIEKLFQIFDFEKELKNKKLAVFDLDETLVHCETRNLEKAEIPIFVSVPNGSIKDQKYKITINVRPNLIQSLKEIKKNYVIVVYTASHKYYADPVLDYIDPNKEIFSYRLYRQNCIKVKMGTEDIYVKDLRLFKNISLNKIVIIDNSVLSFAFHLDNGIPILPFYDSRNDNEMRVLVNYLMYLSSVDDIREENRKFIKMEYLLKRANNEIESENEDINQNVIIDSPACPFLVLKPCQVLTPEAKDVNSSFESLKMHTRNRSSIPRDFKDLIVQKSLEFKNIFS